MLKVSQAHNPLVDLGGFARCTPPYRTQFFCFCIHFHWKAPTSEVHAPLTDVCPPTGNPGSATVILQPVSCVCGCNAMYPLKMLGGCLIIPKILIVFLSPNILSGFVCLCEGIFFGVLFHIIGFQIFSRQLWFQSKTLGLAARYATSIREDVWGRYLLWQRETRLENNKPGISELW